ncbi:uncharacterized protein LOC126452322 [Schistocerca serialis cubense]|uniref:uncharacterized protein LOC126452322 n=1 Tax=Schistocerca serialis cubense TaxID=2023355 RepID=UPI00214E8BAB|nr:uncharacterized protein LOC126452322 [Schistocerca serialis cubense]
MAARVEFYQSRKEPDQTYRQWTAELKGISRKCNFDARISQESYADDVVWDHMIQAAPDAAFCHDALKLEDPSLDQIIDLAFKFEVPTAADHRLETSTDVAVVREETSDVQEDIAAVYAPSHRTPQRTAPASSRRTENKKRRSFKEDNQQLSRGQQRRRREPLCLPSCPGCYSQHEQEDCPDRWATCRRCSRDGHLASVCRSATAPISRHSDTKASVDINQVVSLASPKLYIDVTLLGKPVRLQVDTGAAVSLLNYTT